MTLQEGKSEPFTEVASDHRRSLGKNCEAELVTLLCGARLGVVEVWGGGGGSNSVGKSCSRNGFEDIR